MIFQAGNPPRSVRKAVLSFGIAGYLAVLLGGLAVHQFDHPSRGSIAGYLVVWDMFCGWSGHERRVAYIAEGESGRFYDASEVPGRGVTPHGQSGRRQFDFRGEFSDTLTASVLSRTDHEPIRRVYVVETNTPKRNLPSAATAKTVHRRVQAILSPDGDAVRLPTWNAVQQVYALSPPAAIAPARTASPVRLAGGESAGLYE